MNLPHVKIRRLFYSPLAAAAVLAFPNPAMAASFTWDGDSTALWETGSNWVGDVAPVTTDTAVFNGAGNGNTTIDLGAGQTIAALLFDTSSAAGYTIGSGAVGSQTLTLGTTGTAVMLDGTVTANQLFNSNLALSTNGTFTFLNNSLTNSLTIAGGISASTAGTKILSVSGSGTTAISGAITAGSGAMNLSKFGTGTLTLSGGAALGAGGIANGGANLSAMLLGGTTEISGGAYTSAGEFVVGGVLANGGAGVDTNLTMNGGSLTISSFLSLGRGNGVGAVSSDIVLNNSAAITANNFSAGFNAGSALNMPKGTFTLNNTSSFTVATNGTFLLAESAGSNMTMTLNGSSTLAVNGNGSATNRVIGGNGATGVLTLNDTSSATFGGSILNVGYQNGNGTLNLNGGTFTLANELRVGASNTNGTFSGSGTVNVASGTMTLNALTLARNNNDVASTLTAAFNQTGGVVNITNGQTLIGWRGIGSNGTVNISGGSFNQGTTVTANMTIGSFAGATGAVNVSGSGTLTLQNNSSLRFSDQANANAARTLTISGGNVTFYSDAGSTVGGTGVIDLMLASNPTGTSTINLDGGTLTANQIKATSATGTRVINFNGGTLKSAGSGLASTFLAGNVASTANVRNGGAIIDSNGNSVTIGQTLVHSTIGGDNAIDGGLTKLGAGTLTLTAANTYTGATTISAGTLAIGSAGQLGAGSYAGNISNAGTFDFASTAAQTLSGVISGTGALTKSVGTDTLTLAGANTYTGNTTISTGTLLLDTPGSLAFDIGDNGVNNMITGAGFLTLQGAFVFDLTGAAIVDGNSWLIVDVGTLFAATYEPSFAVSGFTESSDVWTMVEGNNTWTFAESTGVLGLSVVPEPASILLVVGGLMFFTVSRRRTALI